MILIIMFNKKINNNNNNLTNNNNNNSSKCKKTNNLLIIIIMGKNKLKNKFKYYSNYLKKYQIYSIFFIILNLYINPCITIKHK